jgi:hypothetical protein
MAKGQSKLTEEQWAKVIAYYTGGHTLQECEALSGASRWTISYQLKKRGVRVRDRLEPSRPEKAARVRSPQVKAKYVTPQEEITPEGCVAPPKRRIISLSGNGGKGKMLYEKEVTGGYNGNRS